MKNFQQNGRPMHQQQRPQRGGAALPYNKPKLFKPPQGIPPGNNFNQMKMMFNASQIPDNPGYMDFNNPTPPIGGSNNSVSITQGPLQQKKKNNKNKQKNKQPQQQQQQQLQMKPGNWNKNKGPQQQLGGPNNRFNGGMQRGFNPVQMGGPNLRGRRMMPPPLGPGPRGGPMPMPPPPHGFQPPMIPPMPPMGGPMPPMPPPFLRRSGRGGPMPPIPPPMPPMIAPRMPRGLPPVPFNGIGGKIKKPNPKLVKKVIKGKSTIRTLKNLVNQYPIDKPWVTAEIRAEHDKKIDIENRLKGNKDDELFAQFKTQRDKFVAMYETAREEYLKQEAAAVKAKDAKDKQTINKTAAKNGNNKEAIPNKNAKA